MQFSTLIIAALAAVASASPAMEKRVPCPEIDLIPLCGYGCILDAVTAIGCATEDYPCMCSKFADLRLAAASCVYTNCGLAGAGPVLAAAEAVCTACA
ncbi:hypothetical protein BT67DRAFT_369360 [Trichocladium antarcticum]|uniref:CFEM domain-containing protein n=1 Tax=Trichocladium antarcticum TaxID=1450529 RepID=A0AAN6USH0_9PEZI|nr:hypothetical protein BT67DRAFT_369360 [Trichocladium antarcticum]